MATASALWIPMGIGLAAAAGAPGPRVVTRSYTAGTAADTDRRQLDLYAPQGARNAPVLLFLHGGVWQIGSKDEYRNIGEAFAARGIVTAVASYRIAPAARHPAQVEDAAAATVWLQRHAEELGGDPKRVFISGHSAGGHLATLILMDARYLRAVGGTPDSLAGVIALSGIFDLTRPIDDTTEGGFARFIQPVFGRDRAALQDASPIRHLRETPVPQLVVVAGNDYQDMVRQSRDFYEAARAKRLSVTLETVAGRGHFALVHAIGSIEDPTTALIERFVRTPR